MVEKYQREILSPIQMRSKPYDISGPSHPARDEVRKCLGNFNLSISVEEDLETLKLFDRIPGGVVAFMAKVSKDGMCVGVGRGSAIFTKVTKYLSRTVRSAFCASIIDGVVKSCKGLDAIYFAGPEYQQNNIVAPSESYVRTKEVDEFVPISDKQKSFLWRLLQQSNDATEEDFGEIDSLSRDQARQKISQLVGSNGGKINY